MLFLSGSELVAVFCFIMDIFGGTLLNNMAGWRVPCPPKLLFITFITYMLELYRLLMEV